MLVLDIEVTKKAAAREAVTLLKQAHGNCIGTVYNRVARAEDGYQSYLHRYLPSEQEQELLEEKTLTVTRRLIRAVHNGKASLDPRHRMTFCPVRRCSSPGSSPAADE